MLKQVSDLFDLVSQSTAEKGIPALKQEVNQCNKAFNRFVDDRSELNVVDY